MDRFLNSIRKERSQEDAGKGNGAMEPPKKNCQPNNDDNPTGQTVRDRLEEREDSRASTVACRRHLGGAIGGIERITATSPNARQ
jgi:hypothetical protein